MVPGSSGSRGCAEEKAAPRRGGLGARAKGNAQLNITQTAVQLLALLGYKCFKGRFKKELLGAMLAFMALVLCKRCKSQLENDTSVLRYPCIS